MKILAIDLGKFKSVACGFDPETNQSEDETLPTQVFAIEQLLQTAQPQKVVIETCTISGWVYDLCQGNGFEVVVANPSSEAWQWRNVKRKTDKDDALKLAKLEALGQIVPVYMPSPQMRQYRRLVKYRKVLVGRLNQVKSRKTTRNNGKTGRTSATVDDDSRGGTTHRRGDCDDYRRPASV